MRRHPLLWIMTAAFCLGYLIVPAHSADDAWERYPAALEPAKPAEPAKSRTKHIALNMDVHRDREKAAGLGYDLFDVGPYADEINSLSGGQQALIWVGEATCSGLEMPFDEFAATVRKFADNPRVFGYYLSDEPDPDRCPKMITQIRKRADYIRKHAPAQKSYVAATDYDYRPLRSENMHVDLIGLNPYPCMRPGKKCKFGMIDKMVTDAQKAGISRKNLVPIFQAFGGECARNKVNWLPSEAELEEILKRWNRLLPDPAIDVTYSWGHQAQWACPTLVDADGTGGRPDLQSIMKKHNARTTAPKPAPSLRQAPVRPA